VIGIDDLTPGFGFHDGGSGVSGGERQTRSQARKARPHNSPYTRKDVPAPVSPSHEAVFKSPAAKAKRAAKSPSARSSTSKSADDAVPAWLMPKSPMDKLFRKGYGGLGQETLEQTIKTESRQSSPNKLFGAKSPGKAPNCSAKKARVAPSPNGRGLVTRRVQARQEAALEAHRTRQEVSAALHQSIFGQGRGNDEGGGVGNGEGNIDEADAAEYEYEGD